MRVHLGMPAAAFSLIARESSSVPHELLSTCGLQYYPAPNPRNDNAAKRQRAAKKRRKAKAG